MSPELRPRRDDHLVEPLLAALEAPPTRRSRRRTLAWAAAMLLALALLGWSIWYGSA